MFKMVTEKPLFSRISIPFIAFSKFPLPLTKSLVSGSGPSKDTPIIKSGEIFLRDFAKSSVIKEPLVFILLKFFDLYFLQRL